jgi:hypothetical protein
MEWLFEKREFGRVRFPPNRVFVRVFGSAGA